MRKLKPGTTIHADSLAHTIVEYSVKINSFGLELWKKKHLA